MKEQIQLGNAVGKTIAFVEHDSGSRVLIGFMDGSFSQINASTGYEDEPVLNQDEFQPAFFGDAAVIRLGIMTQEELDAQRAHRRAEAEASEHRLFCQLRAKYEGR